MKENVFYFIYLFNASLLVHYIDMVENSKDIKDHTV